MHTLNIHFDGSCYHKDGHMGMGVAFFSGDSEEPFTKLTVKCPNIGTSNEAEYRAVIAALQYLNTHYRRYGNYSEIIIHGDSQLIVNQINAVFECRSEFLSPFLEEVDKERRKWYSLWPIRIKFVWVPREHPRQQVVDKLSKEANPYYADRKK